MTIFTRIIQPSRYPDKNYVTFKLSFKSPFSIRYIYSEISGIIDEEFTQKIKAKLIIKTIVYEIKNFYHKILYAVSFKIKQPVLKHIGILKQILSYIKETYRVKLGMETLQNSVMKEYKEGLYRCFIKKYRYNIGTDKDTSKEELSKNILNYINSL